MPQMILLHSIRFLFLPHVRHSYLLTSRSFSQNQISDFLSGFLLKRFNSYRLFTESVCGKIIQIILCIVAVYNRSTDLDPLVYGIAI